MNRRATTAFSAPVLLALSAGAAPVVTYEAQPALQFSSLVCTDKARVFDSEFAAMARDALVVDAKNNKVVRDAGFYFGQCFGGGMLDDLDAKLNGAAPKVPFLAASASLHTEKSLGQVQGKKWKDWPAVLFNETRAFDFWAVVVAVELEPAGATYYDLAEIARSRDLTGSIRGPVVGGDGKNYQENGQVLFRGGAEDRRFNDPDATGRKAILWAGYTNNPRYFNDINLAWSNLTSRGFAPENIYVLFGDGAKQVQTDAGSDALPGAWKNVKKANKANLQDAFGKLKLKATEQFFFFASDHGDWNTLVPLNVNLFPGPLPIGITLIPLDSRILNALATDDQNVPTLEITLAAPPVGEVSVYWNDALLGTINGVATAALPIPESVITDSNRLTMRLSGSDAVTITSVAFDTGAIGTDLGATGCICLADFDGSGGTPDTTDIDAFFAAWITGDALADADCSGGAPDAHDVDVFFTDWLAGGCP